MANSGSEDNFHSADEEDIPSPPQSQKSQADSLKPRETTTSDTASAKEVKNTGKASKKSKGKKGKKKKASELDEKGDRCKEPKGDAAGTAGGSLDSPAETAGPGQQETKQQSETQGEEERLLSEDVETAEDAESQSHQSGDKVDQMPVVEKSLTQDLESEDMEQQENLSATTEDSQPKDKLQAETDDAKTDSQVPQEAVETENLQTDGDLLETGNKINRDAQDESSKRGEDETAERIDDSTSTSEQTGTLKTAAPDEERSITGALGKLTGEKTVEKKASGGGWGWGGWGASLVSSVSAVGHGLSSVIGNVESSLGLPKPEELTEQERREQEFVVTADEQKDEAESKKEDGDKDEKTKDPGGMEEIERDGAKLVEEEKEKCDETNPEDQAQSPSGMKGFFSLGASAITSVVGKTVTGGLDALETIGRKTMDVLQEGDHSALKGRNRRQKGNLSEMLRDAKEEAETAALLEEEEKERQRAHFGILFDQYQGLAHLEALEMLSNQSESKVLGLLSKLSGEDLGSLKTELIEIRDAFQLEDLESEEQAEGREQDFVNEITEHLFGVSVASTPDKLQRVQRSVHEWLAKCRSHQEEGQKQDIKELHIKAMETLAEFSSRVIEQFHKACELMLLPQDKEHSKSPVQRATSLSKLTSVLVAEVGNQASRFAECLSREATNQEGKESTDDVNPLITNIYLEASNSTSYIQDAFQLVLPVLQMVAMEKKKDAISEAS